MKQPRPFRIRLGSQSQKPKQIYESDDAEDSDAVESGVDDSDREDFSLSDNWMIDWLAFIVSLVLALSITEIRGVLIQTVFLAVEVSYLSSSHFMGLLMKFHSLDE